MGFSCGIVGLPNVGKSTLFNALTHGHAPAENYPFCTIDPNVGAVSVPDPRLDRLAQIFQPKKVTPAQVSFVDIAGLVKGASQGEGLGNQFLSHIRDCDAIAEVVRCFEKTDVTHVAGSVNPIRDIQILETELMLKDLDSVERIFEKTCKRAHTGDKEAAMEAEALKRSIEALKNGTALRKLQWSEAERRYLRALSLITVKPMMLVANAGEENLCAPDAHVNAVLDYARDEGVPAVHLSLKIEAEIIELPEAEQGEFLRSLGLTEPGLHVFIRAGYKLLNLETFLTGGPDEVRAWTFVRGMKAPQCAGVIHTDFEKGFIKAEVYAFGDIDRLGTELAVKEKGLLRQEGKEYAMQDGDVVFFKFNV